MSAGRASSEAEEAAGEVASDGCSAILAAGLETSGMTPVCS